MGNSSSGWGWDGKEEDEVILVHHNGVDHDFAKTFNMEMAQGRFFSREFPTDTARGLVVNEAAAKIMRFDDPIGKNIYIGADTLKIIGVIRDFHFKSVHRKIEPIVLHVTQSSYNLMFVRISGTDFNEVLSYIENKYKEFAPQGAFTYQFLDQQLDNNYRTEQQAKTIFGYFSILAIFIACLG